MKTRTAGAIALSALAVLPVGCTVFGIRTADEAGYEVLREDGDIELRRYGDLVVAETVAGGDYEQASSETFERLFDYISGANRRQESIAMTAPVLQEDAGEQIAESIPVLREKQSGGWKLAFVLPEKYTLDTAPEPANPHVKLTRMEGKNVAAIRYSGSRSEETFRQQSELLAAWLEENEYTAASQPRYAGYDPPWTIPFLRRNEVLIDVE